MKTRVSLALVGLLILAGCGINSQTKGLFNLAAIEAQERAALFAGVSKIIGAVNPAEEAAARILVDAHAKGLAKDAETLAKLAMLVQEYGKLGPQGKQALTLLAEASRGRAENWEAARSKLTARGMDALEWQQIAATHAATLAALAKTLADLNAALAPAKPKE
jgi:hypothetical protein